MTSTRIHWIILSVLLVARLGFAALVYARPHFAIQNDSDRYVPIANTIVAGTAYRWDTERPGELLNTVGYPLFLAAVFATLGDEAGDIAIAQLLVTGIAALVSYAALLGVIGARGAFLAAIVLLLDPLLTLWSMTILTESLFAALVGTGVVTLAVWSISRRRLILVLAGTLLALACLVRPVGVAFLAVCALAILFRPRHDEASGRMRPWLRMRTAALFLVPSIIVLAPWVVRNALLWGCPGLASFDGVAMRDFHAAKIIVETEHVTLEEAQARLQASDPGICPQATDKYWGMIINDPVTYLRLQVAGTIPVVLGTSFDRWLQYLGTPYELPDLWRPAMDEGLGRLLNVLISELKAFPPGIGLMLGLTALQLLMYVLAARGVLAAWRTRMPGQMWLTATIVACLVAMALIPGPSGHERFRVPMLPLLAVLIGAGEGRREAAARPRRGRTQTSGAPKNA